MFCEVSIIIPYRYFKMFYCCPSSSFLSTLTYYFQPHLILFAVIAHSSFISPIFSLTSLETPVKHSFTSFLTLVVVKFKPTYLQIQIYYLQTKKKLRCLSFWVCICSLNKAFSNSTNLSADISFSIFSSSMKFHYVILLHFYYPFSS